MPHARPPRASQPPIRERNRAAPHAGLAEPKSGSDPTASRRGHGFAGPGGRPWERREPSELPPRARLHPTNSMTNKRPGKRERLIIGAREAIHRQGAEATTIAEIAEAADVPPGNVYYYYKSKAELVAAVIDAYAQESLERLSWLEQQHRTPRARLKTLVRLLVSHPDQVVLYGCPRGSLCSELDKQDNELAQACRDLSKSRWSGSSSSSKPWAGVMLAIWRSPCWRRTRGSRSSRTRFVIPSSWSAKGAASSVGSTRSLATLRSRPRVARAAGRGGLPSRGLFTSSVGSSSGSAPWPLSRKQPGDDRAQLPASASKLHSHGTGIQLASIRKYPRRIGRVYSPRRFLTPSNPSATL